MKRTTQALMIVVLLCLLLALPAWAQEATPDVGVVPPAPVEDTVTLPSWLLVNLAGVLVAASALVGVGAAWLASRNLKTTLEHTTQAQKDAIEAAHEALPQSAQDAIDRVLTTVEVLTEQFGALLKFTREVTDGKPNPPPVVILPPSEPPPPGEAMG